MRREAQREVDAINATSSDKSVSDVAVAGRRTSTSIDSGAADELGWVEVLNGPSREPKRRLRETDGSGAQEMRYDHRPKEVGETVRSEREERESRHEERLKEVVRASDNLDVEPDGG
jgi:hypothetical protein